MKLFFISIYITTAVSDQRLRLLHGVSAKCLDGSPVGFYAEQGNLAKVLIWLNGGGGCTDYDNCERRKLNPLGSSDHWPPTRTGTGMQATNVVNPFYDWTHIYLEYCTGDGWVGTQTQRINPWPDQGSADFSFTGHLYIEQVLGHLQAGLSVATDVILAGNSAGGVGTMAHADYLAEWMHAVNPSAKVRSVPMSAFFGLPLDRYEYFAASMRDPGTEVTDALFQTYEPPAKTRCANANPETASLCTHLPYLYPYIQAPIHVSQCAVDSYQVFNQGNAPEEHEAVDYIKYQRIVQANGLKSIVLNGAKTADDGLFVPACLGHSLGWAGSGNGRLVNGKTHAQAVADWYFENGDNHMHFDDNDDLDQLCACTNGQYPLICPPIPGQAVPSESIARFG